MMTEFDRWFMRVSVVLLGAWAAYFTATMHGRLDKVDATVKASIGGVSLPQTPRKPAAAPQTSPAAKSL